MYQTILTVEDDPLQLQQLDRLLTESGYFVLKAPDFDTAKRIVLEETFDLLLLDLRLGDRNGMEILFLVKRLNDNFPVVILSSVGDAGGKVSAFETGVDDYVTKPYHPAELVLRIKRLLKDKKAGEHKIEKVFAIGDAELDAANGIVRKGLKQFFLRKKVLELLLFLYNNRNQVLSKEQIIQAVWGTEFVDENVISVTIHEIRKIIEENPKQPRTVLTMKGLGYKLVV